MDASPADYFSFLFTAMLLFPIFRHASPRCRGPMFTYKCPRARYWSFDGDDACWVFARVTFRARNRWWCAKRFSIYMGMLFRWRGTLLAAARIFGHWWRCYCRCYYVRASIFGLPRHKARWWGAGHCHFKLLRCSSMRRLMPFAASFDLHTQFYYMPAAAWHYADELSATTLTRALLFRRLRAVYAMPYCRRFAFAAYDKHSSRYGFAAHMILHYAYFDIDIRHKQPPAPALILFHTRRANTTTRHARRPDYQDERHYRDPAKVVNITRYNTASLPADFSSIISWCRQHFMHSLRLIAAPPWCGRDSYTRRALRVLFLNYYSAII